MSKRLLSTVKDSAFFVIGEIVVALLVIAVYYALGIYLENVIFTYKVITGAILGSAVMIVNYVALSFFVTRAADKIIELRGKGEMTEEEIEKFTKENTRKIQTTVQLSFFIRTFSMIGVLVIALISGHFDVIATAIPLVCFRPIISAGELFARRGGGAVAAAPESGIAAEENSVTEEATEADAAAEESKEE
jgi:hypothetical protein